MEVALPAFVDVRDVAESCLKVVEKGEGGEGRWLISAGVSRSRALSFRKLPVRWRWREYVGDDPPRCESISQSFSGQEIVNIIREDFPALHDRVPIGHPKEPDPRVYTIDNSKSKKELGTSCECHGWLSSEVS